MKNKETKELTKAEEQVMQAVWRVGQGFANEIVAAVNETSGGEVAYNTVLTVVRILEQKGFISYEAQGKKHIYYPLIEKGEYTRWTLTEMKDKLFNGSARSMVNTFIMESGLSDSDVRELIDMLNMLETAKS